MKLIKIFGAAAVALSLMGAGCFGSGESCHEQANRGRHHDDGGWRCWGGSK